MIITNLCTNPSATIPLNAAVWTPITTVPNVVGTKYWVSVYVNVTGGTISMGGTDISASQRVSYEMTAVNTGAMAVRYRVNSGNPAVTVTNMLLCTLDEYQANKTLLDSIKYFTGDSMPLA